MIAEQICQSEQPLGAGAPALYGATQRPDTQRRGRHRLRGEAPICMRLPRVGRPSGDLPVAGGVSTRQHHMLSAELARVESNLRRVEAFLSSGGGGQAGHFEWTAPLDSPTSSQDDDAAWDDSRGYPPPPARELQQPWGWHLPVPASEPRPRRAWSPVAVRQGGGRALWEQQGQRGGDSGAQEEGQRVAVRPQLSAPFRLSSPAALAGRHSKARVAAEVEHERSVQAPFVPATNAVRRSSTPGRQVRAFCAPANCVAPGLHTCVAVQAPHYTQLKRERLLAERAAREAVEAAECTFRPRTGRAPRASAPGSTTHAAGERLYQLAFRRSAELDAKRAASQEKVCTCWV
jgi:hypothetical protein